MNSEILSGPVVQAIGWALVHLLWQGAIVAAVLGATLSVVSRERSNLRYAISCGALTLMLLLGIATAWKTYEEPATRAFPLAQWTNNAFDPGDMVLGVATAPTWRERVAVVTTMARAWLPQIVLTWLIGVALLSARLLVSWIRAHQLAKRNAVPATDEWQRTMRRLAEALKLRRAVRLLESAAVEVPTVVGWMRPVVLLPASTLTGLSPEQIEMILAHELAHIRRHDFFVNLLQAMVETLMFYHPAVWWMSRQVRIERENCCDDLAVAVCGNALQYARALTRLEELRTAPMQTVLAANGGSLIERIRRLVGVRAEASLGAPRWAAGLAGITVLLLIATGPSLLAQRDAKQKQKEKEETKAATTTVEVSAERLRELSAQDRVDRDEDEGEDDDEDSVYVDIDAPEPPDTPDTPEAAEVPEPPESPEILGIEITPPAPPAPPVYGTPNMYVNVAPVVASAPRMAVAIAPSALAATLAGIDEDEQEERREERARERSRDKGKIGADGKLSIDDLVTLRVHGVTPEYIKETRAAFPGISLDQIVAFKIHGVTPAYMREMQSAGYANLDPDKLIGLRIHGVSADYVRQMRSNFPDATLNDIQSFRIHGMTTEYARMMQSAGFGKLSAKELVAFRIHGVTPEYVREMRAAGLGDIDAKETTAFAVHGIDAEYVRSLRDAGVRLSSAKDVVSLRVHGVTAKFVRTLRDAGYTNLSAKEIARLASAGVNSDFIREMEQYRDKN